MAWRAGHFEMGLGIHLHAAFLSRLFCFCIEFRPFSIISLFHNSAFSSRVLSSFLYCGYGDGDG
jgi:hypothetical protein